jgi:7,8-dihydropterin-6-yl-methyl-4-(beta-D-ribofuranosyl)aminobenzene 5'-phosphate synthase
VYALQETQVEGTKSRLTLFDTGPDSKSLVRNVKAMQVPVAGIDRIILSHWHSDHSGGLLSFLELRAANGVVGPCIVDVHPDRPIARGIAPPPLYDKVIGRLPADPTFAQIEALGATVEKNTVGHLVADGAIYVSGTIPRVTPYEKGILGGVRWVSEDGSAGDWTKEEVGPSIFCRVVIYGVEYCLQHIMDERYAAIDVFGKGLVLLSA